ncbi:hypothetical protein A2U01_0091620, partial [Trifolium medium]|nr:hypothetical protein [Trifolium medium]
SVGVEETVVGVVGGDVEGVSGFTSRFLSAGQYPDRWQWQPDPDRGYSVRGAYQLLTSQQPTALDVAEDLTWHKQ